MVNLLFISSNPKIDSIKNALQPLLKVKIDSVGDFDYGLKEVFEKRPALVFIQDQIAGVTGESVARHIQMLLGSGAPLFIFMHDGDLKSKPVKGLYDYLIDLSQNITKLVADIQSTLKLLLGPEWSKIYIPSMINKSIVKAALAVPEGQRAVADQLVDDFISDLGVASPAPITTSYQLTDSAAPDVCSDEPFTFISSHHDQLADIISETAKVQQRIEATAVEVRDVATEKIVSQSELTMLSVQAKPPVSSLENAAPDVRKSAEVSESLSSVPEDSLSVSTVQGPSVSTNRGVSEKTPSLPVSPADFRIERERRTEDVATEESLLVFETHYISKEAARIWYWGAAVLFVLCLTGGGWYLVTQKPYLLPFAVKKSPPAIVAAPAIQPVTQVPAVQNSISASQRQELTVLPSFIPLAGHDRQFASQKPGWERYVGTDSEFRVFRSAGKIKAVQVLATNSNVISESRLKTILIELTGTSKYRITSREQKLGFQVSRATVNQNVDLLIYRRKTGVHAFVVSLD